MKWEVTSKKVKRRVRCNQYVEKEAKMFVSGAKDEKEALEIANMTSLDKEYWIKAELCKVKTK